MGTALTVGIIELDVELHPGLRKKKDFKVVNDLNGVILIGRTFLKTFDTLEIDWKETA